MGSLLHLPDEYDVYVICGIIATPLVQHDVFINNLWEPKCYTFDTT